MFNKNANPMQMMQMITKAKKAIILGSENFEEKSSVYAYHNKMIEIKTKGDLIQEINFNDEYKSTLSEDPEMASDLLCSSMNSLRWSLNNSKTEEIIAAAEKLKVSKHIVDSIRNEDMLNMM